MGGAAVSLYSPLGGRKWSPFTVSLLAWPMVERSAQCPGPDDQMVVMLAAGAAPWSRQKRGPSRGDIEGVGLGASVEVGGTLAGVLLGARLMEVPLPGAASTAPMLRA